MTTTGTLIPFVPQQFLDDSGVILSGGLIAFKVAGENTDKDTFSTADLDPSGVNSNPVQLDSSGRPPTAIFFEPGLYDVTISDADSLLIKTIEGVGVPEAEAPPNLAVALASGARDVTSGYTVLATDLFITVNSTGGADPCVINLPAVATRGQSICIKNLGDIALSVVPDGSDTIDGSLSSYQVSASGSPNFCNVWLFPDGVSSWWVFAVRF